MKKRMIKLIVMVICLLLCLSYPNYSNIFEEIYYDEYVAVSHFLGPFESSLRRSGNIKNNIRMDTFDELISEEYKKEILPENIKSIIYSFYYPNERILNGEFFISINYKAKSSDIMRISYLYKYQSNQLIRQLKIYSDITKENYFLDEYLKEHNMTAEQYFEIGDHLLKTRIIPDWLKAYPSQFTEGNWGNVEIITNKGEYIE